MAKKDRKKGKTQQDQGTKEVLQPAENKPAQKDEAKAPAQRPLPKKKTPAEKRKARIDGIKKTIYSSLLGVLAGFICFFALGAGTATEFPWHFIMLVVVGLTYYLQRFTYPLMGINSAEFGAKDWFYVEFLVIDLWLVTWTLLLN